MLGYVEPAFDNSNTSPFQNPSYMIGAAAAEKPSISFF